MSTTSTVAIPPAAPRVLSLSDLALVLVVIAWGTNYTVVKEALGSFPPLAFMALRFGIAAVAMAVVLHTREGWKPLPRAPLLKLVGLGLVGNTLYQFCFIMGLAHTTAANSGITRWASARSAPSCPRCASPRSPCSPARPASSCWGCPR